MISHGENSKSNNLSDKAFGHDNLILLGAVPTVRNISYKIEQAFR